jgi:hypothetical protein
MKKLKYRMLSIIVAGVLLIPTIVLADFKSDIIASCSAYQQGGEKSEINACKLYIDGFIDSSLLTKDGVVKPQAMIDRQPKEQSDFLKRAYRTRVVNDSSYLKTHKDYQFCIPLEDNRKVIASKIAKSMNINNLTAKPLKEVLFETLIAEFPCP